MTGKWVHLVNRFLSTFLAVDVN